MAASTKDWEFRILDGYPEGLERIDGLAVGDLDGDGRLEVVAGAFGALLWYRPSDGQAHAIARGSDFTVGLALEDVDGDGRLEVVTAEGNSQKGEWRIAWYKPEGDLEGGWQRHAIDERCIGLAHDLIFADIDGDGHRECVANGVFSPTNGLVIYRRPEDPTQPWPRHIVCSGIHAEGLAAIDLDGDGKVEIVNGPDYYRQPAAGPYAAGWERITYAPDMRDMCRVLLRDVNGDGRPDVIAVESEYLEGRLAWFENPGAASASDPWPEHEIERGLIFAHSMDVWPSKRPGELAFFLGEMSAGGWNQPKNHDARLLRYSSVDDGRSWARQVIEQGQGTHQALVADLDGDGEPEIVGKDWMPTAVQLWHRAEGGRSKQRPYRHAFLDRDKPYTGTDVMAADVDGDGLTDVVCGAWWYRNPTWERYEIPGVHQVINSYDIDGDGRPELIALRAPAEPTGNWYKGLSSKLCWLKPVDARRGEWLQHDVGTGSGDWPHGSLVAPILPGGKLALVVGYHDARAEGGHPPELFAVPDDPTQPWRKQVLADIPYGENFVACDLDGDGDLDIVAGPFWIEATGDGGFRVHRLLAQDFDAARVAVADVDGDGWLDVILGEHVLDFEKQVTPLSRLVWLRNPGHASGEPWPMRVIDRLRCPHSLSVADVDGDGQVEIVCAEHDPFKPYRTRCHLFVYKKADAAGMTWQRFTLDDRFEHHCGAVVADLGDGKPSILSHGWQESRYVHLWQAEE